MAQKVASYDYILNIKASAKVSGVAKEANKVIEALEKNLKGKSPAVTPTMDLSSLKKQASQLKTLSNKLFSFYVDKGVLNEKGKAVFPKFPDKYNSYTYAKGVLGSQETSIKLENKKINDAVKNLEKNKKLLAETMKTGISENLFDKNKKVTPNLALSKDEKAVELLKKVKELEADIARATDSTAKLEANKARLAEIAAQKQELLARYAQEGAITKTGAMVKAKKDEIPLESTTALKQLKTLEEGYEKYQQIIYANEKYQRQIRRQNVTLSEQLSITRGLGGTIKRLGMFVRNYISFFAMKDMANQIIRITAEFERQKVALGSLIGDQAEAIKHFSQLKALALKSPYKALELTEAAKQLAAYSVESKELIKTTKMLGDIAAGTGVDISRLTLAYGQVKTAHYLRGQEVRQFTEAGVPLLEALAKRFTIKSGKEVSAEDVQNMIPKRGVRFEDVKGALDAYTTKGGIFYNMQETMSNTTAGKILKMQDALQQGWERLGKTAKGPLDKILDVATYIASNISSYVKTLGSAVISWKLIAFFAKSSEFSEKKIRKLSDKELIYRQLAENNRNLGNENVALYYDKKAAQKSKKVDSLFAAREKYYAEKQNLFVSWDKSNWNPFNEDRTKKRKERKEARALARASKENHISFSYVEDSEGTFVKDEKKGFRAKKGGVGDAKLKTYKKEYNILGKILQTSKKITGESTLLGRGIKVATASAKIFGIALKSALISSGIGAVLTLIGTIIAKIWSAHDEAKALKKDLADIDIEAEKKTAELVSNFNELANTAVNSADGTEKQKQALEDLAQTYGDIIPIELLKIENLRKMNGEYSDLIAKIKEYQDIESSKNKISTIIDKNDFDVSDSDMDNFFSYGTIKGTLKETRDKYKDQLDFMKSFMYNKYKNGDIVDENTFSQEMEGMYNEMQVAYGEDLTKDFKKNVHVFKGKGLTDVLEKFRPIFFAQRKAEEGRYGDKGFADVEAKNKEIEANQELLRQQQTMAEYEQMAAEIRRKSAKDTWDSLTAEEKKKISISDLEDYITENKDKQVLLDQTGYEVGSRRYNQLSLQFEMLKQTYNTSVSWIDKVLKFFRDVFLKLAGHEAPQQATEVLAKALEGAEAYEEYAKKYKTAKGVLDVYTKQETAAKGQMSQDMAKKILNNNYAPTIEEIKSFGQEAREAVYDIINYRALYKDEEKKTGGNGTKKGPFAEEKQALNDWIGMMDKAKSHYEKLKNYFFDTTALENTTRAYQNQFSKYGVQFKDIMSKLGFNDLKDWIKTDENFELGINAIVDRVDEMIAQAKDKSKKELESFRAVLLQKNSDNLIRRMQEDVQRMIDAINTELDKSKNKIDVFDKIFDLTGNGAIAEKIAMSFYGSMPKDMIYEISKNIKSLMVAGGLNSPDFYDKFTDIRNMLEDKDLIDYEKMHKIFSDLRVPKEIQTQLLESLKSLKEYNMSLLEEAIKYGERENNTDDKRLKESSDYYKHIDNINYAYKRGEIDEITKNDLLAKATEKYTNALADLELESIKSSKIYVDCFGNIEQAGTACLSILREQLEKLKQSFNDDPVKLRQISDEINKINEKIAPKEYSLKDILVPTKAEYKKAIDGFFTANKDYIESHENRKRASQALKYIQEEKDAAKAGMITPGGNNAYVEEYKELSNTKDNLEMRLNYIRGKLGADSLTREQKNKLLKEEADVKKLLINIEDGIDSFHKKIDFDYKEDIDAAQNKLNNATQEEKNAENLKHKAETDLIELEQRRIKAIDQLLGRIEETFKFGADALSTVTNTIKALTTSDIFGGRVKQYNPYKDAKDSIIAGFNAVKEYSESLKGVFDSGLIFWKDFSDKISEWKVNQVGLDDIKAKRDRGETLTDKEQKQLDDSKLIDSKILATIGAGVGLSVLDGIASGDTRTASQGALTAVGGGLMQSKNPYVMAAGAALQFGVAVWNAFDKIHDADIQRKIEKLQDAIDKVADVIQEMANNIRRDTGNGIISGKRSQISQQQKQLELLEQQYKLASKKKKSDDKELKEYKNKIKQMKQSIVDAENELFESLLGGNVDSYMKNLVKTFEGAAKAGQNSFKALKNSFNDMLSNMIQDTIMTTIIKNRLSNFFSQLEIVSKRGSLGQSDIDNMVAEGMNAMQEVNSDLLALQPMINSVNTAFGIAQNSTAGGLASGIKGMSEETAGQMSGYLMANFDRLGEIQRSVFNIETLMSGNTSSGMMTQYQQDAIAHLVQIDANTLRNADRAEQLYNLIDSMKVVNTSGSGAVYGLQTAN